MEFEEKFKFVNGMLETLMTFSEISSLDYVKISKKLMRAEDGIDLVDVMDMMEIAVMDERTRKSKEKRERDEAKRKKDEERVMRRRAK